MEPTIRKRFDSESGCWHVKVLRRDTAEGTWTEVAMHNEEAEADDCIADLTEWKVGR